VAEPYADQRTVELVARDSGARAIVLPSAVNGVKGTDTYLTFLEYNVNALAAALR